MRWQEREALGLGVTMVKGGDVGELGRSLEREVDRVAQQLPVGVELAGVHAAGRAALHQPVPALARGGELIIVLTVSLVSLGLRTGLVVAVSIPLVLAAVTFVCMWLFGIGLHRSRWARSSSRSASWWTTRSSRSR
ncbi:MAG: hypothetical protein U1F10_01030 [Burkholderiales bacterium]